MSKVLLDSVLVRRSINSEIEVYDERDKFIASRRRGEWYNKLIFNNYELEEFTIVEDEDEIARVLSEARAALNKPLMMELSNDKETAD